MVGNILHGLMVLTNSAWTHGFAILVHGLIVDHVVHGLMHLPFSAQTHGFTL